MVCIKQSARQSSTLTTARTHTNNIRTHILHAQPNLRLIMIIIMVIFKCYFSGELIALSYINKQNINNNSGVNIELGKTKRLKALCMMEIKKLNKQTMCQ